jgi:hypothetical protein
MHRVIAGLVLLVLVGGLASTAEAQRRRRRPRPAAVDGRRHNEPAVLEPLVTVATTPRKNVSLGFGFADLEHRGAEESSFTFTTGYTYVPRGGDWSLGMKLPIGSVGEFLLGDIAFDSRWRALNAPGGTRIALGFTFVLPSSLLNSLGGSNDEIRIRREESLVYNGLNLLPIRYWNLGPYFALSQRAGPILITGDAGLFFLLASKERNRYESPRPEFAVRYDLAVTALFYREMIGGVIELNGLSWITDQSGDNKDGPLIRTGTGLTLTLGLRFLPAPPALLTVGVQIPITGDYKVGAYDLTNLYFHELSVIAEARFLL